MLKRIIRPLIEGTVGIGVRLKILGITIPPVVAHRRERLFISMVAFGVCLEFLALPFSLLEAAKTGAHVAEAKKEAAQARLQASEAESNLAVLQLQVRWRTITSAQSNEIISLLRPFNQAHFMLKKFVRVFVDKADFESWQYANRLSDVLKQCDLDVDFEPMFMGGGSPKTGIRYDLSDSPEFAEAMFDALASAGIRGTTNRNLAAHPDGTVTIWVWHKPEK